MGGGLESCERYVHTRQGLPRGCVAAAGRATSVGLRNCSAASRKNARVDCETVCNGLATPRARSAQGGKMMRGRDWFHKVCVRKKRCLRVRLSVCDLACDTDIGCVHVKTDPRVCFRRSRAPPTLPNIHTRMFQCAEMAFGGGAIAKSTIQCPSSRGTSQSVGGFRVHGKDILCARGGRRHTTV